MARSFEERDSWEALLQDAEEARVVVEALYEETMRRSGTPPEPMPTPPKQGSAAPPPPS